MVQGASQWQQLQLTNDNNLYRLQQDIIALQQQLTAAPERQQRLTSLQQTAEFKLKQQQQLLSSQLPQLSARRQQLQAEFASLQIKAPYAGIMVYLPDYNGEKSSVGDTVQFGQPVAEVSQLESLYIKTEIDEVDLKYLQPGLSVQITLDAYPERNFSGVLTDLGKAVRNKSAENLSRVVDASIKLDEPDLNIMRPGMSARLVIRLSQGAN